jgi:hypothetical protein
MDPDDSESPPNQGCDVFVALNLSLRQLREAHVKPLDCVVGEITDAK